MVGTCKPQACVMRRRSTGEDEMEREREREIKR
jgi:hypothetical protein